PRIAHHRAAQLSVDRALDWARSRLVGRVAAGAGRSGVGPQWTRRTWRRCLRRNGLGGAGALAAALAGGLVLTSGCGTTHRMPDPSVVPAGTTSPAVSSSIGHDEVQARMDALADQPMPSLPLSAAVPIPLSTPTPGAALLPRATRAGPAGVPSGYPHTVLGALAQLAAVEKAALQPARVETAKAVIAHWAAPGGPG